MEFHISKMGRLSSIEKYELFKYRYDVFVKKLGWNLSAPEGIEIDQFDNENSVYVIAKSHSEIVGCARLLPTNQPYLLQEVFPDLLDGAEPPKSIKIWEVSRFTNCYLSQPEDPASDLAGIDSALFLTEIMRVAKEVGAEKLISVSTIGMERLLNRSGIRTIRLGKPKEINGYRVFACQVDLIESD